MNCTIPVSFEATARTYSSSTQQLSSDQLHQESTLCIRQPVLPLQNTPHLTICASHFRRWHWCQSRQRQRLALSSLLNKRDKPRCLWGKKKLNHRLERRNAIWKTMSHITHWILKIWWLRFFLTLFHQLSTKAAWLFSQHYEKAKKPNSSARRISKIQNKRKSPKVFCYSPGSRFLVVLFYMALAKTFKTARISRKFSKQLSKF